MNGPVVGISGLPGSGKSTLAASLATRLGATRVAFDDYEIMTRQPPERIRDWIARGAPLAEVSAPGFAEAVAAAQGCGGPVVVEAPLGRAWPSTAHSFDWSGWIDCPADLALARKVGALLSRPGAPAARLEALANFLHAYPVVMRSALRAQAAAVPPTCDMVLNGLAPASAVVDETEAALLGFMARM